MYIAARITWICDVFYPSLAKQGIFSPAVICLPICCLVAMM